MISFNINGVGYAAHFSHIIRQPQDARGLEPGCNGVTEVLITKLEDGTPVMAADARAKAPDNFSRSLGRQISLGRAAAALGANRRERKQIMAMVK